MGFDNDLNELEINVNFEDIRKMTKNTWKNIIKNTINQKTFLELESLKQTHSKVKVLRHIRLEMQDYFLPNEIEKMNKEEVQLIFKIRSTSIDVKMNRKKISLKC